MNVLLSSQESVKQESPSVPERSEGERQESLCPDFERLLSVDLRETIEKHMYQITFFEGLALASQGENKCHKFSDFVTREQMWQLEANQIIFAAIPYDDQMVMMVEGEVNLRDPFTYYTLYRSWGEWTERDRLLLNLFHPHLIQAYHTILHWQRQQHQINDLKESLDSTGVIFLTPKGDAHAITRQASEWLRLYFPGVQSPSRLPETLQSWVSHQINQIYCTEPYPALLPLRIQQSDRQLIIRFTIDQFKKSYLLLLAEEQPLSPLASLELLGLSKREAEIMLGVLQGQDNKAIAQTLPIAVSTVRKHLENIYRKLNVQSRSEAIALVIQKLGGLNSPPIDPAPKNSNP